MLEISAADLPQRMIQSQTHSCILTLFLLGFKDNCFPKTPKTYLNS